MSSGTSVGSSFAEIFRICEVQEQLREKLGEMRAMGLPLPADLVALEKRLDDDFYAAGN